MLCSCRFPDGYSPRQPRPLLLALHPGGERMRYYGSPAPSDRAACGGVPRRDHRCADCPITPGPIRTLETAVMTLLERVMVSMQSRPHTGEKVVVGYNGQPWLSSPRQPYPWRVRRTRRSRRWAPCRDPHHPQPPGSGDAVLPRQSGSPTRTAGEQCVSGARLTNTLRDGCMRPGAVSRAPCVESRRSGPWHERSRDARRARWSV